MSVREEEPTAVRVGRRPAVRRVRPRLQRRTRRRRTFLVAALVVAALLTPVAWSLTAALTRPGSDTATERLAEWARDHGAGGLVTWMERKTYQAPKVGGAPPATSPLE